MIKTTLKLSICLFITLPITSQTYLYEMFSPTVSDARSVSMGRTSTASGMNSNSIFSNPSIIANFDDWRFQAGGRLIMQKNTLQEKDFDVYEPKRTPHYSISHLSFSMPYQLPPEFSSLTPKLSFGIGYKMYFDYGQNTDLVTQQGKRQKIRRVINSKGGLDVITPTVALKFDDRLSVGISFNTSLSGKITESHDSGRDVLKTEIETDYSFLRYGLLGKINDQLTLGFSFPFPLSNPCSFSFGNPYPFP